MASNGREALEIMSASGPSDFDLILMDIQMPEMDGLTATREIRTRLGFDEIPIIAMTAHTMDHEKQSGIEAGMNDHIGKPFETADFYRILAKWLPRIKQQELPDGIGQLPDDQGLQPISGVDTRAGLARFGGNEARYWHWLSVFVEEAPAFSAQIRSALANAQEERARKAAHAIKGRVGMLGMTDLHAIVTVLEETLRRGEPADDLLDSMQDTIAKICDELQSAFDAADSDRDASVSRRQEGAET